MPRRNNGPLRGIHSNTAALKAAKGWLGLGFRVWCVGLSGGSGLKGLGFGV